MLNISQTYTTAFVKARPLEVHSEVSVQMTGFALEQSLVIGKVRIERRHAVFELANCFVLRCVKINSIELNRVTAGMELCHRPGVIQ